jgi:hypothetical protein
MKRSMITLILVLSSILFLLFILFALRDTSTESISTLFSDTDALERQLEMKRHEKLQALKSNPKNVLTEFTTDGCSGGLSVGWEFLAGKIQTFKETYGTKPDWESCCETHDLAYYAGGSRTATAAMSFEARRKADLDLKACVIETGMKHSLELTKEYNISATKLKHIYNGIANMMYRAVRIGGMPCTNLPWRWGYGWPECKQLNIPPKIL